MSEMIVNGVPLILVVAGLVGFAKSMGLQGRALTGLSLALGVALGILYQLSISVPTTLAGWFGAAITGLALGLTASGLYDVARMDLTGKR